MKNLIMALFVFAGLATAAYGFDYGIDDALTLSRGTPGAMAYAGIWMNEASDMNVTGLEASWGITDNLMITAGADLFQFEDGDWEADQYSVGAKVGVIPEKVALKLSYNFSDEENSDYYRITAIGMTKFSDASLIVNAGYASSEATDIIPVGVSLGLPISYTSYLIVKGQMIYSFESGSHDNYIRHLEAGAGLGYEIHDYVDLELTGTLISQALYIGDEKTYDDEFVKFQACIKYRPGL